MVLSVERRPIHWFLRYRDKPNPMAPDWTYEMRPRDRARWQRTLRSRVDADAVRRPDEAAGGAAAGGAAAAGVAAAEEWEPRPGATVVPFTEREGVTASDPAPSPDAEWVEVDDHQHPPAS